MLWAPQLEHMPSLWQYLQAVLAYAVPPVVALFVTGLFWRGATARGAHAAFLGGSLLGLAMFVLNVVLHVTHIHFLYVAPLLFAADVLILAVVSRLDSAQRATAATEALHWSRATYAAETARLAALPWWRNYRVQSLLLLTLTAWVVYAFR